MMKIDIYLGLLKGRIPKLIYWRLNHYGFPRDYVLYPDNNSITSIDFYANFWIKEVVIPSGITTIRNYSFYECTSLQKVYIPLSVTYIEESALDLSAPYNPVDSIDIYYEGTEEQWNEIHKSDCYGDSEPILHFETTPADMHS